MFYGSEQDKQTAVKRYCEQLRKAASMYSMIAPVIRDFDGKVYNKRLEKAIREKAGVHVMVNKRYDMFVAVEYYDYESFCLAQIRVDELIDGKRIPAEKMIEDAQSRRAGFLKEAAKMEQALNDIDVIRKQLNTLKATYNAITETLPYRMRDIYNINTL